MKKQIFLILSLCTAHLFAGQWQVVRSSQARNNTYKTVNSNNSHTTSQDLFGNVNYALSHQIDINQQDENGQTYLHQAAIYGESHLIEQLINNGASITKQDNKGSTPLHWAASLNQIAAIKLLMQLGACKCLQIQNREGNTPIHWAAAKSSAGLDLMLNSKNNIPRHIIINMANKDGMTPLHWAASNGNFQALSTLLDLGADVDTQDTHKGRTALHWVIRMREGSPNKGGEQIKPERAIAMLEKLLEHNAQPTIADNEGKTPIYWAAKQQLEHEQNLFLPYLNYKNENASSTQKNEAAQQPSNVNNYCGNRQSASETKSNNAEDTLPLFNFSNENLKKSSKKQQVTRHPRQKIARRRSSNVQKSSENKQPTCDTQSNNAEQFMAMFKELFFGTNENEGIASKPPYVSHFRKRPSIGRQRSLNRCLHTYATWAPKSNNAK